jgi:hypothetical protein
MKPTGKVVLTVRIDVPPEIENEFNEWYDTEHIPNLLKVPGVISAKRCVCYEGEGPKYIAIYEHLNDQIAESASYKQAAETEWTKRLRQHFTKLEVNRFYEI